MSNHVTFAVGGAVQVKQGTYLERPADQELLAACQAAEFSYVLACRQIGKSSLMLETARRLSEAGIRTAQIDLNRIGLDVNAEQWYFSLIDELARRLKLKSDVQTWWETRPRLSAIPTRFLQFFDEVVLREIEEPIVIFIDEIDMTLNLYFTDDFFAAIRSIHNDRTQNPAYQRLTFVLLGVATPDELIKDNTRTPFNVGQAITLRDFTQEESDPFRRELETRYPQQGGPYFDQIYGWTNGHPYLIQKLCQAALNAAQEDGPDLVERLVRKLFLAPEARSEDNIQFVQSRVTTDSYAQAMLRTYKSILQNEAAIPDDEQSPPINKLKLYGLVVAEKGRLKIRNKLYAHAFDLTWADELLNSIRLGLPNKYTLLKKLGQRGFVTVYLAQDTSLNRDVALKVLNVSEEAKADWRSRIEQLERKARIVSEANHPGIIHILETGRIDEKTLYIAMEYIAGGNLRERLNEGPLARNEAIEIIRQVGTALTHIHQQGIFHLAVNPNDILLNKQQEPLQVVLTDFGFASFLLQEPRAQIQRDYIMLTPHYVAPEQEQPAPLTPAADVYGLAVTFFEMLAGHLPPDRQPGEPLPPLSAVKAEIGELFDEALIEATARNPADRYQSVVEFIEALESAIRNEAAKLIDVARSYIKVANYDPQIALAMIASALEIYPEHPEALRLRGKVRLKQRQFAEALADYKRAYEQEPDPKPSSEAGREYLAALSQVADASWQTGACLEATQYYETIRQILDAPDYDEDIQKIRQTARTRLVQYHCREGRHAYAEGSPKNIAEAAGTLEREIKALEALGATHESQALKNNLRSLQIKYHHDMGIEAYAEGNPPDIEQAITILTNEIKALEELKAAPEIQALRDKLKLLQIKNYEDIIQTQEAAIEGIKVQNDSLNEDIFQHYSKIDIAYQKLIELDGENEQWPAEGREKLREETADRQIFAQKAEAELEYEIALRHYRAILDLKQTRYEQLDEALSFDLTAKIAELEEKVGYDRKYRHIESLIEQGDHLTALNQLIQDFINAGNYDHRGVARLFWGLVYAKQHAGIFPPEWKLPKAEQELVRVRQEADSAQARLVETEANLAEAKKELNRLQTEAATVQAQLIEAQQKLDQVQAEAATAQAKLVETEQELERARAEAATAQAMSATTHHKLEQVEQNLIKERAKLVATKQEAATAQAKFSEAETKAAQLQSQLTRTEQQLTALKKPHRAHEINKYTVPIVLIAAVVAGGVIAPQLQHLPGLFTLTIIALAGLIAYFGYYLWTYYWPAWRHSKLGSWVKNVLTRP